MDVGNGEIMSVPQGDYLAFYNGGSWNAYMTDATKARLQRARVRKFMLHAGPRGILGTDPDKADTHDPTALIAWIRGFVPDAEFQFGLGLDGWTSYLMANLLPKNAPTDPPRATPAAEETVSKLFRQIAAMARSLGVTGVMADSEAASKQSPSAGEVMARLFVSVFRQEAPELILSHTTYDDPCSIETPPGSHHWWGGQSPFPYKAWLGQADLASMVAFEAKQNYDARTSGYATIGEQVWRINRSNESYAAAIKAGMVNPNMPFAIYLQVHNNSRYAIVTGAMDQLTMFAWALGTAGNDETCDEEGVLGLAMLAKLRDKGYRGPGALDRFLDDTHTRVSPTDHSFGPKAEAALAAM